MSDYTLTLTPSLYKYYQAHACKEVDVLAELRAYTRQVYGDRAIMQIAPEQGQFLQVFLKAIQASKILEIGTFAGYSALCMALALPDDGQLITCDIDADATSVAKQYWKKAGLENKIQSKLGDAELTLKELITNLHQEEQFDFAFIDADKLKNDRYYEYCLQLTKSGGVIAIDNTLSHGAVAEPADQRPNVLAIRQLNAKLLQDSRVLISMLPIADGLTLAYKQ